MCGVSIVGYHTALILSHMGLGKGRDAETGHQSGFPLFDRRIGARNASTTDRRPGVVFLKLPTGSRLGTDLHETARMEMSTIESEYQWRMDALSGTERIARTMAMLKWTREMLARQIIAQEGSMSEERLRWKVALRLYASDKAACQMIESRLTHVPD